MPRNVIVGAVVTAVGLFLMLALAPAIPDPVDIVWWIGLVALIVGVVILLIALINLIPGSRRGL